MRNEILNISKLLLDGNNSDAMQIVDNLIELKSNDLKASSHQSWFTLLTRFKSFLNDHINGVIDNDYVLPFNVFKVGNKKLPFINYSTIPLTNCVGASECKKYCYSLNSMRFPLASLSWLQNQILETHYFNIIDREFSMIISKAKFKKQLAKQGHIDFRLYNDGDFSTIENMMKWFNLLKKYPSIKCYGYTKSLNLIRTLTLLDYEFPNNYRFNVSNGGKYDNLGQSTIIKENPCYRGNFIAYNLNDKRHKTSHGISKDEIKTIRNDFDKKVFICPLVCDTCTSKGHACGSDNFKNLDIVIPIH